MYRFYIAYFNDQIIAIQQVAFKENNFADLIAFGDSSSFQYPDIIPIAWRSTIGHILHIYINTEKSKWQEEQLAKEKQKRLEEQQRYEAEIQRRRERGETIPLVDEATIDEDEEDEEE